MLITAPNDGVATALARRFVERRVASCVNVVSGVTSVYRWEGEVQEDPEALLIVKTTTERLDELESVLADEHPYDTPEFVALEPAHVEPRYAAWLLAESAR